MKIKEIEFGMTIGYGNYESSKLSIRAEVNEEEDYHQILIQLKEEVIKHVGVSGSRQAHLLEMIARADGNQELQKTAEKIAEVDRLLQSKKEDLEDKLYRLGQLEDKVNKTSSLVETITQFLDNCTIDEAHNIVESYRKIKSTDLTEELDEESLESPF